MLRLASLGAVFILTSTAMSSDWLFVLLPNIAIDQQTHPVATDSIGHDCAHCPTAPEAIVFTGDMMLARYVERLATKNGDHYSFANFSSFLKRSDAVVTNFEASIPVSHTPTPDFTMRFSVPYRLAALLPEYNIQFASLANNHAYDFNEEGYINTQTQLARLGVTAFGHPSRIDNTAVAYVELSESTVAIVGIHTLYRQPEIEELTNVFTEAALRSDWQVAYVHWGNEYEQLHSNAQQAMAEQLVAAGADVIIGHHPHVVQDIAMIDGVPVFYSLGNFIFDQYFSTVVQEGLLVRLRFNTTEIDYELIPVTSKYSIAQPRLMSSSAAADFITKIRNRSNLSISDQLLVGFQPAFGLATSTQISIMTE